MFEIAKRTWGGRARPHRSTVVTADKILNVFAYGTQNDVTGLSLPESEAQGLVRLIDWQSEREWPIKVAIKGFKLGDRLVIPPHIKWSANPLFAYVGLDAVEFRCGNDQASSWFLCPKAEHIDDVKKIEALFQYWYERLGLPQSLTGGAAADISRAATVSDSPIRGFKVLALRYPKQASPPAQSLSTTTLAEALSREMDVAWFGNTPEMAHFVVSDLTEGTGDREGTTAFDFGPYDEGADRFATRHTVLVRMTAGGGVMLLLQKSGAEHETMIVSLFDRIIADATRP